MDLGCSKVAVAKSTLAFTLYGRFSRLAHTTDNVLNNLPSDNHMCNQPRNTNIAIRQHRRTSPHQIRRPRARLVKCLSQTIKANQLTPRMILQTLLPPPQWDPSQTPISASAPTKTALQSTALSNTCDDLPPVTQTGRER
jgi:hypothetical protein